MLHRTHFITLLSLIPGIFMLNTLVPAQSDLTGPAMLWISTDPAPANTHFAFRGKFTLPDEAEVEFQFSGASWYVVWLDGEYFYEGPDRYAAAFPEYQSRKINLGKGNHLVAIQVHNEGIETRILDAIHPFLFCLMLNQEMIIPVTWKCLTLDGYEHTGFRINAEPGWIEWADTRKIPADWQDIHFNDAGWAFIDWGYVPNPEPSDMGLNLHYYIALQNMVKWSGLINRKDRIAEYERLEAQIFTIIQNWFVKNSENGRYQWDKIGYHRIVLGMLAGFIPRDQQKEAVAFVKKHILNCFPNNPDAPRLSDPGANHPQLITPYFSHFAFQVLIEQGEMDFVLDQYRKCWGWALEDGRTTWVEVFDTRWSHAHQWAGSPTWQLSRYVLGLHPQFDQRVYQFKLDLHTGDLIRAHGKVPLPDGKTIQVNWEKVDNMIRYEIITPAPLTILIPPDLKASKKGTITVKDRLVLSIPYVMSK